MAWSCPSDLLRGLTLSEKKSLAGLVAVSLPADDLADGLWSLTLLEDILQLLDLDKDLAEGFYPITERSRRGLPRPADSKAAWEARVEPFRVCLPPLGEPRSAVLRDLMVIVALRCGYDARTRVTFRRVCDAMQVRWHPRVSEVESTLARKVYERVARDRERELRTDRWRGFKIGAAMIGGGTLLAVTGGLAAPALAAGIAASSSVIGATAAATLSGFATTAWMATLFGAGGAGLVGYKMDRRTQGVKEFEFESETSVGEEMCVSICVPGVLKDKADLQRGWGVEPRGSDVSAKERLRRFYYVHNRAKVGDVEDILVAYDGKESKLCKALQDRYGADPRDPPTREALARAEGRRVEGVSQEDLARDAAAIEQLMETVLMKEKQETEKAKARAAEEAKLAKEDSARNAGTTRFSTNPGDNRRPSPPAARNPSGRNPLATSASRQTGDDRMPLPVDTSTAAGRGSSGLSSSQAGSHPLAAAACRMPSPVDTSTAAGRGSSGLSSSHAVSHPLAAVADRMPSPVDTSTAAGRGSSGRSSSQAGSHPLAAAAYRMSSPVDTSTAAGRGSSGLSFSHAVTHPLAAPEAAGTVAPAAAAGVPPHPTAAPRDSGGNDGFGTGSGGGGDGLLRDWDRGPDGQVESLRGGVGGMSLAAEVGISSAAAATSKKVEEESDEIQIFVEAAAGSSTTTAGRGPSRSKMTRLKNAVTPDNRGKSKAGLNGVGVSGGSSNSGGGSSSSKNEARCAAGVIENVCLLGAPVGATAARWERVARMAHGRVINGYSKSDVIIGLVFRAKSLSLSVSGIQKVSAVGVENVDLSSVVGSNHFNYNRKMPEILELLDLDNCSKYIGPGDSAEDCSPAPPAGQRLGSDDVVVYGTTVVPT